MEAKDLFNKEGIYKCIKDWYGRRNEKWFTKNKLYKLEMFNGYLAMLDSYGVHRRNLHFSQWLKEYKEHFIRIDCGN